ncbi:hypothetical protein Vretimale_22 [Volvox reticuliferus]|uniref:Uncharacterized protein n=1 Tax=Volvox reticuliferus TaxID=1737510 RepID=A0A8J4CCJ0_9CHLO|nr:hypothetical protein Vretifemale_8372 [Volvox reticuliferus]GIL93703.1 hypothetical protein Vretimale_22 [Volvox reticuliferus]
MLLMVILRDAYESNSPAGPGGAFNILRLVGHSKHLSSGFVGFAIKTISVSASASIIFGITSYMVFSKHLGPAMPFLGGAAFGFVGGLVHRYITDTEEVRAACGCGRRAGCNGWCRANTLQRQYEGQNFDINKVQTHIHTILVATLTAGVVGHS